MVFVDFDLGSGRQAAAKTDLPGFEVGPDFQPSSPRNR
jgi:hypothetical protein